MDIGIGTSAPYCRTCRSGCYQSGRPPFDPQNRFFDPFDVLNMLSSLICISRREGGGNRGADIESKDHTGRTPLSWAAGDRQEAVVKVLLSAGANINTRDTMDGSPLSMATREWHKATAI